MKLQNKTWKITAVLGIASLLTMAATSYASLEAGFGTEYLGANPDGTHRWETTVTNLSPHASSDYAIYKLDLTGALADGYGATTDKFWDLLNFENQQPNPQDNHFSLGTSDPDEYLVPQLARGDKIMKINYTTPADYDTLAPGTMTVDSVYAGQIEITGPLVIPEPTVIGLIGLISGAMFVANRFFSER